MILTLARSLALIGIIAGTSPQAAKTAEWLQWGGPTRDFTVDVKGLASSWPASGPKRLWARLLGEGHSSVLVDGNRLFTMYRVPNATAPGQRGEQEAVVALDAATGKTVWEFPYPAPTAGLDFQNGAGPHSTPLIAGNRVFAASSLKELFALNKQTGRKLWSRDFIKEYNAPKPGRGYTCSPLAYKDTLIVTMGGSNQTLAAFSQETGALVWKAGNFMFSPASPILIDVGGQPQVVVLGGDAVVGLDPTNGNTLWSHPHQTEWGLAISTPVWNAADQLLLISSAYDTGTRALELKQAGGRTTVTEKWFSRRMRVHIGSVIRVGDHAYGASGDFGPAFITAINLRDGSVAWQDRSFARAQLLYADNKLIILDEDGTLGIATVAPTGLRVLARSEVLTHLAWTPPTLAGTTLYVRDRTRVLAFNLGGS